MTSTRPKRNVRNATPAPPVEDDATIVRNIVERLVYTADVISRFNRTRSDIAAIHRGESDKTMAQVMTESRWHEQATKAKKECPLGSTKKRKQYEEDEEEESEEDDPDVPSTSTKPPPKTKPTPEKKPPTPSKAKLAAMKRKADAERRKAQRDAKKLEALAEKEAEDNEDVDDSFEGMPILEKATDEPLGADSCLPELDSLETSASNTKPASPVAPNLEVSSISSGRLVYEPAAETMEIDEHPNESRNINKEEENIQDQTDEAMEVDEQPKIETEQTTPSTSNETEQCDPPRLESEVEAPMEKKAPVKEEVPVEKEGPVREEEVKVEEEIKIEKEVTVAKEIPVETELPAEEEAPVTKESPVETEVPVETVQPPPVSQEPSTSSAMYDLGKEDSYPVEDIKNPEQPTTIATEENTEPNDPSLPEAQISAADVHKTSEESTTPVKPDREKSIYLQRTDRFRVFHPDLHEPDEIEYTPGEIARQPWLAKKYNNTWIYPFNFMPPLSDGVPGRVWWPLTGRCESIPEEWREVGPLTELHTLDFSLRDVYTTSMTQDHGDLIKKRFCELLIPYYKKKIVDATTPQMFMYELHRRLANCERQLEFTLSRPMQQRLRILCLPGPPLPEIPQMSVLHRYTKFDPTWYTSSRRWSIKSRQHQENQITQRDFLEHFHETTDSTILEFQKEMLEKAKKVEEEAAAERVKHFQFPLLHDLRNLKPFLKNQMLVFREKIARNYPYEEFERTYMNDPACREICKIVSPMPAESGNTIREAEEELYALISSYKRRFAAENPVIQLPKAGNERKPNERDITRITERCVADLIDTVVLRDLSDCPTYPHHVPVHNNAIEKF